MGRNDVTAKRAIFYDCETTGVRSEADRIIELAAYAPDGESSFSYLINPGIPIPKEATAIHQITDEMVADAPEFAKIAEEFVAFCGENAILVAHNNERFDRLFLAEEFRRSKIDLPEWGYFDTLLWARRYRPDLPRHSLQFLREMYGIVENQAHRALDDVKVLYQVFCAMIDDLSIEQASELLAQAGKVTHMPFGKHRGALLSSLPKNYLKWLNQSGALDKPDNQSLKEALLKSALI